MISIIILLSILSGVLLYTTINLLKKNEAQEDALEQQAAIMASYLEYMDKLSKIIDHSADRLQKLDVNGAFASDDEIGWFFEEVKTIQSRLNKFRLVNINQDAEEKK
jgi:Na+-transporting NADH:ubiquinone oxidoreductase subunit NqrC